MSSASSPRISVITAVRNGEKYLLQAVDSILAQTFPDFEYILINDDSSDRTAELLRARRDPRVKIVTNPAHLGLTASLNLGLDRARGEYIARMDADDISLPGRLEKQVRFLDENSGIAALGTGFTRIGPEGEPLRDVHYPSESRLIKWDLAFHNPLAHSSAMIRRACLTSVNGYDVSYKRSQDYDLWWRISQVSELANLTDIAVLIRLHPGQVTANEQAEQLETGIRIDRKHLSRLTGREISGGTIQALWERDFSRPAETARAVKLILEYAGIMVSGTQAPREQWMIRRDAFRRALRLILKQLVQPLVFRNGTQ